MLKLLSSVNEISADISLSKPTIFTLCLSFRRNLSIVSFIEFKNQTSKIFIRQTSVLKVFLIFT